jgi:hypothetical protein
VEALGVTIARSVERAGRAEPEVEEIPAEFDDLDGVKTSARPVGRGPTEEVEAVAEVVRKRLRFVRDAVLRDPATIDERVMIVRLEALGLLTADEALTLGKLLGDLHEKVEKWPSAERAKFLDSAWRFGTRLATTVFDRLVRQRLSGSGWFVADFEQPDNHRPDFLASYGGEWALLAARLGAPPSTVTTTSSRLARTELSANVPARAVVIPDRDKGAKEQLDGGPVVVIKLNHLIADPQLLFGAAEREAVG